MCQDHLEGLFAKYDEVIDQMPVVFTSHQFIQRLAQQHQGPYIQALYAYREAQAPFQALHAVMARHLNAFENLQKLGQVASTNIFGQSSRCKQWRRI